MTNVNTKSEEKNSFESTEFNYDNYDNSDWPRDFDIRIEKAEQREVFDIT